MIKFLKIVDYMKTCFKTYRKQVTEMINNQKLIVLMFWNHNGFTPSRHWKLYFIQAKNKR